MARLEQQAKASASDIGSNMAVALSGSLAFILAILATAPMPAAAQSEIPKICEVRPPMRCLDKQKLEGQTIRVPINTVGIQKDAFLICDSSYNYTTSPDIVLIMDNTGSMAKVTVINGIPRHCLFPDKEVGDPGCISGDPDSLRGPALKLFLDSAMVKGGTNINVGVVLFADDADPQSQSLLPLNAGSKDAIKASIETRGQGQTNYTAAFRAAMDLLKTSRKPKAEQFIIFVSDGRPNLPSVDDGGAYIYKRFWDSLPVVHSIFLGDNQANYQDMKDISEKTGGLFFPIRDVKKLAEILTDDISRNLFRRAVPTSTVITNTTTGTRMAMDTTRIRIADSGTYTLKMPGPLNLAKGVNDIVVKTEYGTGGRTQDVNFKIERTTEGPFWPGLEQVCRNLPKLVLYDYQNQPINLLGLPYTIADTALKYQLTTTSAPDSFYVNIRTQSRSTAQADQEAVPNGPFNRVDSTWSGKLTFDHLQSTKKVADRLLQIDHGETIIVTYHNPFLREDSVEARVRVKYGPDLDVASYWDLDGNGRIETVKILYRDDLRMVPDKLQFNITDLNRTSASRTAQLSKDEIRYARRPDNSDILSSLVVTLSDPFPYGITSVANVDTSGHTFKQSNVPFVEGTFPVNDSVPPVIAVAEVRGPDRSNQLTRIIVTYSEPVVFSQITLEPLVFKRDTVVFSASQIPLNHIEPLDNGQYAFHLSAGAAFIPVGGDSVAINKNGETTDLARRKPDVLTFALIRGNAPKQKLTDLFVVFANGSSSKAVASPGATFPQKSGFIPVDSVGFPMPGDRSAGKCPECDPSQGGLFVGSVIVVVTRQPVRYELSIFTNHGEFVTRATGEITKDDLKLLGRTPESGRDPNLRDYQQRIVWTGQTEKRQMAGTGAYVLKGVFRFDKNFETGGQPSTDVRVRRFGFMRACCASYVKWYE